MTNIFRIPDILKKWPFPHWINPHYHDVSKESANWTRGFQAFSPNAQKAFDKCKFGLLATLTFPTQDKEQYRSACDIMNLFFVINEHTDVLDPASVQALANISMDALLNPTKPRPDRESVIGEMTRQFWSRAILQVATPISRARFEWSWRLYMTSVIEQAKDREGDQVRTMEEYMAVRRLTIGVEPSYALAEIGLSLPQEVYDHPLVKELQTDVTDMLIYDNDLALYNKEQASRDDLHNIVTTAIHENNQGLNEVLKWVASCHKEWMEHALAMWPQVLALSFSHQVDEDLTMYIDHLMNWPRADECWAFESGRYFGKDGLQVQKERVVELLPKGVKGLANL